MQHCFIDTANNYRDWILEHGCNIDHICCVIFAALW